MRVLCILGRHKWRVDNSDPERPFEICDRCGHYRNDVHWVQWGTRTGYRSVWPRGRNEADGSQAQAVVAEGCDRRPSPERFRRRRCSCPSEVRLPSQ